MRSDVIYRIWQFWQSLKEPPGPEDMGLVKSILTPDELDLFLQLPVPDQNHSIRVLMSLRTRGEQDPHLLKAALLHDIGKIKYPLKLWERVFSVLVRGLFPERIKNWGNGKPVGFSRPLVVINHHPDWGADYAEKVGSSPETIWLIQNHECEKVVERISEWEDLLFKLQAADNQN